MPTHKKGLLEILSEHSPQLMSNGQIRMECPFRENHTDGSGKFSFFISPDIGAYHCFSCRKKGNAAQLLSTKFGVNYFEAVELVRLTEYTLEEKVFDLDIKWDIIPPKSFLERGITKDTLQHFKVGTMLDDSHKWIIIPFYTDFKKPIELVGYQKRINVPERVVQNSKHFLKKEYLYNLDFSYSYVVLVEGYSDVYRLYQHGYNATAVLGADVSFWQAEQLSKFETVYLAFDNDIAGRRATEIAYELLKNHTDVKLVPYPTKDPGECISPKTWRSAFFKATDYLEYTLEMAIHWDGYDEMKEDVLRTLRKRTK